MINSKLKVFNERTICPACNYKSSQQLIRLEWDDEDIVKLFKYRGYPLDFLQEGAYVIMECDRCGLLYQRYSPNQEFSEKIYNNWIGKRRDANIDDYGFNPYNSKSTIKNISQINYLLSHLPLKKTSEIKVLDFGMGWGGFCKAAQMMGLTVYGIEVTQNQVEYAKSQGLKVISWDEIPNYNFSIINSEQVLEHVDNPFSIVQHLLKGLSPKGLIRISVPKGENVKCTLSKKPKKTWFTSKGAKYGLSPIEPLQHLNSFNNHSRITMMSLLGLKPVKSSFGNYMNSSIGTYSLINMIKYVIKGLLQFRDGNKIIFTRK
jgi:2-polyprenyl-3-methyl-5-hydroxy-6-metoxy-1,4-benzoquinol methylase